MTAGRDLAGLMAEISEALEYRSPRSAELHRRAESRLVDGVSHTFRHIEPFAPRIVSAGGAFCVDEDGHRILDFWQGHLANVLGHNPEVVTAVLADAFEGGWGLQTGLVEDLQSEVADLLCRRTDSERVRLTTSGTLANLYAVMVSCAFTGRDAVMKVGGGWQGGHPWALKGSFPDAAGSFVGVDSEGLPPALADQVVVTRFNDCDRLRADFEQHGDRMAAFVVEPMVGAGGLIPASREYLELARALCDGVGALLVFDEVITGFRFHAGTLGQLYGVRPDLTVLGKIIGGGMPMAAVAGRPDVLELAGRDQHCRVYFSGGTFSGHPAALLASRAMLLHLTDHEREVYSRLGRIGELMRGAMVRGFVGEGIAACTTGAGEMLPHGSSVGMLHFPRDDHGPPDGPEQVYDPHLYDQDLRNRVLAPALLVEDVHLLHGHGAASTAHMEEDMELLERACRLVAIRTNCFG